MNAIVALCISIALGITGQILLKTGALTDSKGMKIYFQPIIIAAFIGYGVSAMLYTYALKKIPLTIAYTSISISYFAVAYLAHLIWDEPFGWPQIIGLIFIASGIFLISR